MRFLFGSGENMASVILTAYICLFYQLWHFACNQEKILITDHFWALMENKKELDEDV